MLECHESDCRESEEALLTIQGFAIFWNAWSEEEALQQLGQENVPVRQVGLGVSHAGENIN